MLARTQVRRWKFSKSTIMENADSAQASVKQGLDCISRNLQLQLPLVV